MSHAHSHRRAPMLTAAVVTVAAACLATPAAAAEPDLLASSRDLLRAARASVAAATDPLTRAELLLRTGQPAAAAALLPELAAAGADGDRLAIRILLAASDFAAVGGRVQALDPEDSRNRALIYEWWVVTDDLAALDDATCRRLAGDAPAVIDRLAAGRLRQLLLDPTGAEAYFAPALAAAVTPDERLLALRGLASVAFERRDFDLSLRLLQLALDLGELDPSLILDLNSTLIRLGRTDEAIAAAELTVDLSPYHERGHYILGNGYARKNYTQLGEAYPLSFADAAGRAALTAADQSLAGGDFAAAERAYDELRRAHPQWADVRTRIGSLEFSRGRFRLAREHFVASLELCAEYGRAHNGLAKAVEAERMTVEVHRGDYEAAFAARAMPVVERIDELVTNWIALSPRHQKQVALSVAPLRRYLPVLIEGGLTYYIKPLYELLSETPGQATLRDLRISYDSRLWDDVRGCGGYHTVTGVEDVERTVLERYNTVLHELSHQVHGVLPAASGRRIQELYREAKERDQATGEAFLSRYAGGSVWEYFAEGMNAWETPRRDAYDTRDIVRERLEAKDPALRRLVLEFKDDAEVAPCFPVALVGKGDQELEHARPDAAIESYEKALGYDPKEPTALAARVNALQLAGRASEAVSRAAEALVLHPTDGQLALGQAGALWHAGRGLDTAIATLTAARERVREEERNRVDLELGRLHWTAGDAASALTAYARALDYQADNPDALHGRGEALALAGDWPAAWRSYDTAVRLRTGVVELRVAYARDLMLAGDNAAARLQIDAAVLLDAASPQVRAVDAWWQLEAGNPALGREIAMATLADYDWCTLARMVAARAAAVVGESEEAARLGAPLASRLASGAPPRYVFRADRGRYEEVETHPAVERQLFAGRLRPAATDAGDKQSVQPARVPAAGGTR